MTKIGLYFGTTTGNTEEIANQIKETFEELVPDSIEVFNVADDDLSTMPDFQALILGIPTWDDGVMQYDWDEVVSELDEMDFEDKKAAIFGLGDQMGYPDTFQDAIGILGKKMQECGAQLVGYTSTEGYDFDESCGVEDGRFMGLALDVDNDVDLVDEKITAWVKQIKEEFGL